MNRAVLIALALVSGAAQAQMAAPAATAGVQAAAIKDNSVLRDAEGNRVGQVTRVNAGADGSVESVQVIVGERFVRVPGATLSVSDRGLTTSLTRADVRKMR